MQIDWVSVTFKSADALHKIVSLCGDFVELERGGMGYSNSGLVWGSGRVYWNVARDDMGVHLSLSSSALAMAAASGFDTLSLVKMFRLDWFGEFTRIDFAVDDKVGLLSLDTIIACVRSRWYVSRFKSWQLVENSGGGRTISFGSRSSASYLRIYDKRIEQMQKSVRDASIDVSSLPDSWVRVELELKGKRATASVDALLSVSPGGLGVLVSGWIRSLLEFKVEDLDLNKSRWNVSCWWLEFLDFVEKVILVVPPVVVTIERMRGWVISQVAPALCVLRAVFGVDFLDSVADGGGYRLKSKHLRLLDLNLI